MSDDDRGKGGPERPMLILGDDLPDVEDTTPEQLRREQEEARREIEAARRKAQEEIERKRREAEREIAELEREKERELRERERELERTHKKLYRRESQLLRKAATSGTTKPTKRLVPPPPRTPLREKGLRRSALGLALAAVAAVALTTGGLTAGSSADHELHADLGSTDEARALWLQSGLEADEAIARRMAGLPVGEGSDGSLPGTALATEAARLAPDSVRYGERAVDRTEEMLAEETGTVRALTLWSQVHDEAAYAVASYQVDDLREEAVGDRSGPAVWVGLGLAALVALLAMALVARSWLAVPALVAATGMAVAMLPVISGGVNRDIEQAAEDHDVADHALDRIYDQVGRDLEAAYGISTSSYTSRSEYWTDDPFYDVEPSEPLAVYLEAREAVGEAEGEDATFAAAVELVEAGRAAFDERLPALEDARARMLDGLGQTTARTAPILLGLGGAALAVTGVVLSRGRRETA